MEDFFRRISEACRDLLPVATVAAGALIAFWLNRRGQREQHEQSARHAAYSSLIQGIAKNAIAHKYGDMDEVKDSSIDIARARVEIALHGSDDVVRKLSRFLALGGELVSKSQREAFGELCLAMRKDGLADRSAIKLNDLWIVLFGGESRNTL
jgi:hypothetical protein